MSVGHTNGVCRIKIKVVFALQRLRRGLCRADADSQRLILDAGDFQSFASSAVELLANRSAERCGPGRGWIICMCERDVLRPQGKDCEAIAPAGGPAQCATNRKTSAHFGAQ